MPTYRVDKSSSDELKRSHAPPILIRLVIAYVVIFKKPQFSESYKRSALASISSTNKLMRLVLFNLTYQSRETAKSDSRIYGAGSGIECEIHCSRHSNPPSSVPERAIYRQGPEIWGQVSLY
jgi:hypothetical protein